MTGGADADELSIFDVTDKFGRSVSRVDNGRIHGESLDGVDAFVGRGFGFVALRYREVCPFVSLSRKRYSPRVSLVISNLPGMAVLLIRYPRPVGDSPRFLRSEREARGAMTGRSPVTYGEHAAQGSFMCFRV
jgi:hypothetical protein